MWLAPHFQATPLLRFDRFMELALYDPEHGYYSRHVSLGARGDFSTSATLSGAVGHAVAAWIRDQRITPRHVIEVGAGTGDLARCVLASLKQDFAAPGRWPAFASRKARLTYHIVERSPVLRHAQRKALRGCVHWHDDLPGALGASDGVALIFSNELADAFPPRVFRRDDAWSELFLTVRDGFLAEHWQPADTLPDSSVFARSWPAGQRVEVHESFRRWLSRWLPRWNSGQLLTIDYGGSPSEIYHRRPAGTLRAYCRHERHEGARIYELPGRKDLTADVNFDDLDAWGRALGLETVSRSTQSEWLATVAKRQEAADRFLADPHGAGAAFKVLLQRKREIAP